MIALGKIDDTRLLMNGERITIGKNEYIVTYHINGWYLDGKISRVSNAKPFTELNITPVNWCKKHKINPVNTGGVFPWMSQKDITKAVRLLRHELNIQDKKAIL